MKIAPIGLTLKNATANSFKANESVCPTCQSTCADGKCEHKNHKHPNIPAISGWVTAGALAVAIISGAAHKHKLHIASAAISAVAGVTHIASVTGHHHKHHKDIVA